MRNTRNALVELYDCHGCFLGHIAPARVAEYLRLGANVKARAGTRIKALRLLPPPPPPSASHTTPTTITLRDVLANVGLPCTEGDDPRHGSHQHYLSRARELAAQDKVAKFAPVQPQGHPGHMRPQFVDLLLLVDVLPAPYAYDFT